MSVDVHEMLYPERERETAHHVFSTFLSTVLATRQAFLMADARGSTAMTVEICELETFVIYD